MERQSEYPLVPTFEATPAALARYENSLYSQMSYNNPLHYYQPSITAAYMSSIRVTVVTVYLQDVRMTDLCGSAYEWLSAKS